LIGLLDEYLREFRPHLLHGPDPGTLFVNRAGKAMEPSQVLEVVATLTLQHGGRRVTPHLFRDIVAFAWLKAHPKDYLTLSKMLWHSNPNTTIQTYASRFNESSGVCAMDDWLEERAAKSK
jgi:integrase